MDKNQEFTPESKGLLNYDPIVIPETENVYQGPALTITQKPADGTTKDQPFASGTGGSVNYAGYSDAAMDVLLSACASAEETGDELLRLCRYLRTRSPILPLCFKRTSVLTRGNVLEGLNPTASDPFHQPESITINLSKSD